MDRDHPDRTGILTDVVHGGEPRWNSYDALVHPIVQTATYTFRATEELVQYMSGDLEREEYGRYGNPTVRVLERKVATLERTGDAVVFASGMAALTTTILALTKAGSHIVLFSDCYRRTRRFIVRTLERFGVGHTLIPAADLDALEESLRPETRLVVSELPTNPFQNVVDLRRLAEICRRRNVLTLIDSTFATPINLQPAEHGIDLVVHSATKYLAGHNDVLCGTVAGSQVLTSLIRELRHELGAILDPHAAFLVQRGLKTLGLRVRHQNASALRLAGALEAHPRVRRVWYPGLRSHPHYEIAAGLLQGFGGVVTFEVEGDVASTSRFVDACRIPRIGPSLGGVESLIEQPSLMSYFDLEPEERDAIGMRGTLVRLSVGVEDTDDLLSDLYRALG